MQPFVFHTPTKIAFGEDTAGGIADLLSELGATKPLLVTDANLVKTGILQPILRSLEEAGMRDFATFDQVPPDSDLISVRKAAEVASNAGCDSVIAVGGGSVLDTAKVANIGLTFGGDILNFEGMNTLSSKLLPMIAVPTTAGTGSEVSAVAMIKDHEHHKKLLFGSRFLFPDVAVLDPKLLLSLPPKLTAATGLDALTHAIESYTASTTNAPSDGLCLEAMRLLFKSIPAATANGADIEARSETLIASMMAGVSFTNAGVGLVHAIAHSIGAKYGTHHGVTNAVLLPHGMRFNLDAVEEKYAAAYAFLSASSTAANNGKQKFHLESNQSKAATLLIDAVNNLLDQTKLPKRLSEIGLPKLTDEAISELAESASTDPAILFNPKTASVEELAEIIREAY